MLRKLMVGSVRNVERLFQMMMKVELENVVILGLMKLGSVMSAVHIMMMRMRRMTVVLMNQKKIFIGDVKNVVLTMILKKKLWNVVGRLILMTYNSSGWYLRGGSRRSRFRDRVARRRRAAAKREEAKVDPNDLCGDGDRNVCPKCKSANIILSSLDSSGFAVVLCRDCGLLSTVGNSSSKTEKGVDPNG